MTAVKFWVDTASVEGIIQRINQVGRVVIKQHRYDWEASDSAIVDTSATENKTFEFPFGPKKVTYSNSSLEYREIQRPGRKPVLKATNPRLRTLNLNALMADRESGGKLSIEEDLQTLKDIASEDADLTFTHGGVQLGYFVRIVRLNITSLERDLSGEITQATVDINFQEVVSVNTKVSNIAAITVDAITPNATIPPTPEEQVVMSASDKFAYASQHETVLGSQHASADTYAYEIARQPPNIHPTLGPEEYKLVELE
mgnify:CR=1 FL=1